MRYNPDTERGIRLEDVADYRTLPAPKPGSRTWDCANGRWINVPSDSAEAEAEAEAERLEGEATISLWNARYKLQQLQPGLIPAATIASLKRDVHDIARELQRLS